MKIAYLFLCFILSFTFTYAQSLEDFEEISEDVLELLESNTSSVDLILVEKETLFEKSMQSIGVYKKAKLLKDKSIKFKGNKKELEKELAKGKISKVYVDYSYTSELDEVKEIIHYNEVSTNLALSGNGIKIAILDTGSYGTVTYEEDFSGSQTTTDIFGHGKYVQTIVSSFAPNAQIYSLKVLGDTGSGTGSSIYAGIMKAVELDVDIIQMSLGVAIANDPYVQTALEYAREEGVILVASAGNCGSGACGSFTGVTFPANSDEVLAVSSVDKQGVRSSFSSTGSELNYSMIGEDLMVLGSSISGTSFAAPQLSGTLALLLEHSEDESSLYAGAVDLGDAGFDNEYGNGLVDLAKLFDLEGENPLELEDENFSFINIELANTQYAFLLLTNGSDFAQAAHHYYFENDDEFTVYEQSFSSYYELVHYMQSYYSSSLSSASGDFLTLDGKDYWYYENSLFFSQSSLGESETEELLSFFPKEDWSTFLHNTSSFVSSSLSQSYDENGNPVYAAQYGAGTWQEAQNAPFPYPSNFYHLSFGESNRESYYTQYADNWYYVSTDLNGYLEFTIVDIDSGDDLDLYVYDYQGNKNRLCSSTKGSNLDESCTITKNNNNLWGFYVKVVPYGLSGLSAKGTIELIHHPSSCATGFISNTNFCEAGTYLYADWQNADCSIEEKLKADCDDGFPKYTSWGAEYCRSSTGDIEKRRSKELSACSSSSAACISWTTSEYSTVESCSYGCDTASDSCYECTQDSHCSSGEVCSSHSCVLSAVQVTCYKDKDEDSYGDSNSPHTFTDSCSSYGGYSYVSNALDCDDNDDQLTPQTDWFLDADYDGYTPDLTSATVRNRCTRPSSKYKLWEELSSHSKADCDDANAQISPISDWYRDTDGDSYAYNPSTPQIFNTCTRPFGYKLASEIESTADCDDTQYSTSNSCESNSGDDLCSGTFQVITETSTGAGLEGIIIHENANSQIQVTDSFGQVSFHYTDIGCFEDIEFRAYCPDQRLCQYETQSIRDSFNSLVFDCSMCVPEAKDLSFERESLIITDSSVSINVSSLGYTGNAEISLYLQDDTGLRDENGILTQTKSLTANSEETLTFTVNNLDEIKYLHLYIDEENEISEDNEDNNYVFSAVRKKAKVYLEVDFGTSFSILNNLTREYISSYVTLVNDIEDSQYHVIIGDSALSQHLSLTDLMNLKTKHKDFTKDYTAELFVEEEYLVSRTGPLPKLYVFSNGMQGTIAGIKRLINGKDFFFSPTSYFYNDVSGEFTNPPHELIDNYDKLGLSVKDRLNKESLGIHLNLNDEVLRKQVEEVLYDNVMEVSIKPVKTLSETSYGEEIQLRVKNLNVDYSQRYKDAFQISETPVVMSGGLFSDLNSFDSFGRDLVDEGYDVWLIEMNGGPETDCEDCPDYTYEDLVDYHWPASIAGVMAYSGENKINYIGHSNGCRAALSSLNKYSESGKESAGYYLDVSDGEWKYTNLSSLPVDKFFGIACPSVLNGESPFVNSLRVTDLAYDGESFYQKSIAQTAFEEIPTSKKHLEMYDLASSLAADMYLRGEVELGTFLIYIGSIKDHFFGPSKISRSLFQFYLDLGKSNETSKWLIDENDDFRNVSISDIYLFNGKPNDLILNTEDADYIYNQINLIDEVTKHKSPYDVGFSIFDNHGTLKDKTYVQDRIKEVLKNE